MTGYPVEGGCSCGQVRYKLKRAPMYVHCCHCLDCQKQTGGAFAINALVEAAEVELVTGAPHAIAMATESGRPHDIFRCPDCQVALWSDYGRRGYLLFLRVSTLDEPHAIRPDIHIFTRSKVPWVALPEGVPAVDIYYDMNEMWPADSLARRKAVSESAKG